MTQEEKDVKVVAAKKVVAEAKTEVAEQEAKEVLAEVEAEVVE